MRSALRYFNTGHAALPSARVRDAIRDWTRIVAKFGSDSPAVLDALETADFGKIEAQQSLTASTLSRHWKGLEHLYASVATLSNCKPADLVFVPTFLNALLLGLRLWENIGISNLVYTDLDHPNVINGLHAFCETLGISIQAIALREIALNSGTAAAESALRQKMASVRNTILFIPHVDYKYGLTFDINSLATRIGSSNVLMVDAVHSIGQQPFRLGELGSALVLGCGHKWLGGWRASAFLSAHGNEEFRLRASRFWTAQVHLAFSTFDRVTRHQHFEDWGSVCEIPLISLGIAANDVIARGVEAITEHSRSLARLLRDSLARDWSLTKVSSLSGIHFFAPKSEGFDSVFWVERLREEFNISVSGYNGPQPGLRICIAHHNTKEDLEVLVQALSTMESRSSRSRTSAIG